MSEVPRTPAQLLELFNLLPAEDQAAFLRLLGGQLTAEGAFLVSSVLPLTEQARYTDLIADGLDGLFGQLALQACQFAQVPSGSDEDLAAMILGHTAAAQGEYDATLQEVLLARQKEQRDRPHDPETIRRNVEICTLRRADRRKWSIIKLARKYGVTERYIKSVLQEEPLWRRRATKRGSN